MLLFISSLLLGFFLIFTSQGIFIFLKKDRNSIQKFNIEDIIVFTLSYLSLILLSDKILNFNPSLRSILLVIAVLIPIAIFILLILLIIYYKNYQSFELSSLFFKLPKLSSIYWFISFFIGYLIRALVKSKSFNEVIYIPSRYNTDIFLYLRRISVFLGNNTAFDHQYDGVAALDVLYDSPKLLSSLIYAIFTDIFQHPGIAGTVLTSLILTAIAIKYILLLKDRNSLPKLLYIAVIIFIFFQPSLSWLQDQFYLSNLLYLYLLIYAVEDLLVSQSLNNKIFFKFAISAIAVAGFYPSQLPFLGCATVILIFLSNECLSRKILHTVKIATITIAVALIFITQYLATSEVTQHFNLRDSQHGVNFIYIPFWSLLNLVPKPGGFKVSFGSITLVIVSIAIAILITKYLAHKFPEIAKYLYLSLLLYIVYSISFIIFPGSYRQGKFFVTYIIPLVLYCSLKIVRKLKIRRKYFATAIAMLLTIYVAGNSIDRQYKSHLTLDIQQQITSLKTQDKPITIYYNRPDHRYYYLNYQLRNYTVATIDRCPSLAELAKNRQLNRVTVISQSCNLVDVAEINQKNLIKISL